MPFLSNTNFKNLYRSVRLLSSKTYYDVLNLPKNCSAKQLKESYIKLTKLYHPDRNKNPNAKFKFQQVSEAYNVLKEHDSRRFYDLGLRTKPKDVDQDQEEVTPANNPWHDPIFWNNRNKSQDRYYENKSYYGVEGLKKLSNGIIVLACVSIAILGFTLQLFAVMHSFTLRRDLMLENSMISQNALNKVKDQAERNGNELQIELLKQRLEKKESKGQEPIIPLSENP